MFSIYYLEIISSTKLISKKVSSDATMGKRVNYIVCGFYIALFALMSIIQGIRNKVVSSREDQEDDLTSIEVYYMKNWFFKQKPFEKPYKARLTIFDFSQITLSVIQFIYLLMNLFIAKESMLIFTYEAVENGFS